VLLYSDEKKTKIGKPFLKNFQVTGEIESQLKGKKIRVATYKAKSRYRRVVGHRQLLSKIKIKKIKSSKTSKKQSSRKAKK
jgi:large subunit ribosomal protein L21